MKKGLNIQLTNSQYDYLYDLIMSAYDLDVPDQKGWDIQTLDNLVDNVCIWDFDKFFYHNFNNILTTRTI